MRVSGVKRHFQSFTQMYFPNSDVVFANQSRQPKGRISNSLIIITPGNVKRPNTSVDEYIDGEIIANYHSRIAMTVDLFTKGSPLKNDEGEIFAYEDTSEDDLLSFVDFVNSKYALEWCKKHDISIAVEGDVQPLTGIVNDTTYEFRSRVVFVIYFTQKAIGFAPVFSEDSIKYPTGEFDEFGEPIYSTEKPVQKESFTGSPNGGTGGSSSGTGGSTGGAGSSDGGTEDFVGNWSNEPIIDKVIDPSPGTGGRNEELANVELGYFTQVEIKEEETKDE